MIDNQRLDHIAFRNIRQIKTLQKNCNACLEDHRKIDTAVIA